MSLVRNGEMVSLLRRVSRVSWLHEQVSLAKLQNRGQTLCYSLNSLNTIQYQTLNICSSWTYPLSNVLSGIRVREINNNYFDFNKSDQVLWQGISDRESLVENLWWRISAIAFEIIHLKSYIPLESFQRVWGTGSHCISVQS